MKTVYAIIYISLMIALTVCAVLARRSTRPSRGAVAWLETALMVPLLGSLIVMLSGSRELSLFGYYTFFIGVNMMLLALVNFTNSYCQGIGNGTGERKPTVIYIALGLDTAQLLLNNIFGHAFDVEAVTEGGETTIRLVTYFGQTIHRVVGYGVLLSVILIYLIAVLLTPKVYRERYLVLLASMIAVGILQAYFILSGSAYDRSTIGYGIFGIIIYYFAIIYRPLRLLDQMLSNIISDLSDAFYVFDPTGKCIWANEQGCLLAGYTGSNYEDIKPLLESKFGQLLDTGEKSSKRSIGEGDEIRFFSLEEKQVKGSNGKYSGSYLRIQDVTEEEQEIKLRDRQIGQISMEAYKDALTGVGNKASYNNKVSEVNAQIADGLNEFAVVMVDMNDLKHINDEYGHRAGDLYIKGCCHLICEIFCHSPVFRIGGDEFVAILRGQDFDLRLRKVQELRTAFEQAFTKTDQDPWLRYSAAVGMAEHASDDNSFELVFKRADKAMYEEKKLFKALHGSYRN